MKISVTLIVLLVLTLTVGTVMATLAGSASATADSDSATAEFASQNCRKAESNCDAGPCAEECCKTCGCAENKDCVNCDCNCSVEKGRCRKAEKPTGSCCRK